MKCIDVCLVEAFSSFKSKRDVQENTFIRLMGIADFYPSSTQSRDFNLSYIRAFPIYGHEGYVNKGLGIILNSNNDEHKLIIKLVD